MRYCAIYFVNGKYHSIIAPSLQDLREMLPFGYTNVKVWEIGIEVDLNGVEL